MAEEVAVRDPTVAEPPVREEKMPETARKMFAKREVEVALVVFRFVENRLVVVAFVVVELSAISVVEAKRPLVNHSGVEVAEVVVPKTVV